MIRSPHAGAAQLVAGWTERGGHQRRRRQARAPDPGAARRVHPAAAASDRSTASTSGSSATSAHSRVARSDILAFTRMGADVTVCGPPTLIPRGSRRSAARPPRRCDRLGEADVIYVLRMQHERMHQSFVPSLREYAARYQINHERLRPDQLVMHPGPVNRGVELSADDDRLAARADRRPGQGRSGRPDGGPVRAAGRLADPGGGRVMRRDEAAVRPVPPRRPIC